MPGASGVRGGFDSHAFPPFFAALLAIVLLLAVAGPAACATSRDSTLRLRPWHGQPRVVMLRSLVIPGWGQLHNRSYLKAVAVAVGEGLLVSRIAGDTRDLDVYAARVRAAEADSDNVARSLAATEYNATLDRLVGHQWLLGGVIAYALVDAYVDAHFRDFDIEFRTDPALPDGIPPAAPARMSGAPSGSLGWRAALRWRF